MLPTPSPGPVRLLDQVRERMRYLHYSLRTEVAYVHWIRRFVLWSGKRHPKEMGRAEVESFLTHLASVLRVSPATHRQALSAPLYLLYWSLINFKLIRLPALGRSDSRAKQTKLPSGLGEAGSSRAARPFAFASLGRLPSSVQSPPAANAG